MGMTPRRDEAPRCRSLIVVLAGEPLADAHTTAPVPLFRSRGHCWCVKGLIMRLWSVNQCFASRRLAIRLAACATVKAGAL